MIQTVEIRLLPTAELYQTITIKAKYKVICMEDNKNEIIEDEEKIIFRYLVTPDSIQKDPEPIDFLCCPEMKPVIIASGPAFLKLNSYFMPQNDDS